MNLFLDIIIGVSSTLLSASLFLSIIFGTLFLIELVFIRDESDRVNQLSRAALFFFFTGVAAWTFLYFISHYIL